MSENLTTALVTLGLSLIGLTALATVVSPKANTVKVVQAGAGGFAGLLNAATSPVTGATNMGGIPGGSWT